MFKYDVTMDYSSIPTYQTDSLVEATHLAVGAALHTGKRFVVRTSDTSLFSVNPDQFDHRRITPESALKLKALAHELITNIDEIVPETKPEGPQ